MKKVIALIGPTGVGKTNLSILLSKHYNLEIISGDSVQVYRLLNIGSGKITENEKQGVKHHLIDILDPIEDYSACDFQRNARELIEKLDIPFIVGGTGFYIKATLFDYEFTSEKRTDAYDNLTNLEIYNKLIELNDNSLPDINNRKRLLRHLEVLLDGKNPSKKDEPLYDYLIIGLTASREIIYDRINKRVDKMLEDGLIEEAKKLYDSGIRSKAVTSIGYKELYDYFDGLITIDEAINLVKQHSRNYAKRQYTWFNNQMNVHWIDITESDPFPEAVKIIDEFLKK